MEFQRQGNGRRGGSRQTGAPAKRQRVTGNLVWPPSTPNGAPGPQSVDIVAVGSDGSILGSEVRNRPGIPGAVALREPWEFEFSSRSRVAALRMRFHAEPAASGQVLRIADFEVFPGKRKGGADSVVAVGKVARVSITVLGELDPGAESMVLITAWDGDDRVVAVEPDSVKFSIEGSNPVVSWSDGRLRGLRPGLASLRAEAGGVRGELVKVGVGEAEVRLRGDGLRGPIAIEADRSGPWLLRPDQAGVLNLRWELDKGLLVPVRVADRQFAGWFIGNRRVGDKPNLMRLPALGPDEILVARYTPSLPRQGFVPNFKRPDHGYWSSLPRTFRIDPSIVGHERDVVREGLLRWSVATGGVVGLVEATGSEVEDVSVTFGYLPRDRDGETTTSGSKQSDGRVLLRKARIVLSDRLRLVRPELRDTNLSGVACHEAGHALGIFSQDNQGHSKSNQDVMSPRVQARAIWPTPRDLNTLASIYPTAFTGTELPPKRR